MIEIKNREFIDLKMKLFDKVYSRLNNCQREAVYSINGPLLVLAGAGSGKTTVLVNRISHILKYGNLYSDDCNIENEGMYLPQMRRLLDNGTDVEISELLSEMSTPPAIPSEVLCITFTNKAANEFKERLISLLGDKSTDIWAGTFHSICVRILRKYIHFLGFSNNFTIYDTDDVKKLITVIMKDSNINTDTLPVKAVIDAISGAKETRMMPEDYVTEYTKDAREKNIAFIYTEYMKRLRALSALDFDDIILYTAMLFDECPDVLGKFQRKFKYILVDEYQDTNPSQNDLVLMLAAVHKNICVVGDDDQSIYSFRGATVENILKFDANFKETKIVKLEQNYRSTKNILAAANAVIVHNISRKGKSLWTDNADGDLINVKQLQTQTEEAAYIAEKILNIVSAGGDLSEIAVLIRTNAQASAVEGAFTKARIPYRVFGGIRFYERKEVKDLVAYLSLIVNHGDDMRLRRIVNIPKRSIGETSISILAKIARDENISLYDVARHANEYTELSKSASKFERFFTLIEDLTEFAINRSISELLREIVSRTGYIEMLQSSHEDRDKVEIVEEFVSYAALFEESSPEPTLSAFLEDIALVSDVDSYDKNTAAVTIMTVHSSKGLEFGTVFLPGFEDGLFPSSRSIESTAGQEEERRLAYVAITRAKKNLEILFTKTRMIFGKTEYAQPSRFLDEIPAEYKNTEVLAIVNRFRDIVRTKPVEKHKSIRTTPYIVGEPDKNNDLITAGMNIEHTVFGSGKIISAKPMANDNLLEVEFENGQIKKLMQNYAKLKIID